MLRIFPWLWKTHKLSPSLLGDVASTKRSWGRGASIYVPWGGGPEPQRGNPSSLAWIPSSGPFTVISFHLGIFFGVKYMSERVIRYRINVFLIVWQPKLWKTYLLLMREKHPVTPPQCIPKSVPLSSLFRSELLWALSVAAVYQLLSLLTLLLERTLQESAIYRVIHILILKSGAQHSLPLSLSLDYICPIKRVFKSHVRGCGKASLYPLG